MKGQQISLRSLYILEHDSLNEVHDLCKRNEPKSFSADKHQIEMFMFIAQQH